MVTEVNRTFSGRVVLDDNAYENCTFTDANLIFYGGGPPDFKACTFVRCEWTFSSSARNTVAFLRQMAQSKSGFRRIFEQVFPTEKSP